MFPARGLDPRVHVFGDLKPWMAGVTPGTARKAGRPGAAKGTARSI